VTDHEARDVVAAAGGRPVFGVFADAAPDTILRRRDATGIRGAQLHGAVAETAAARLAAEGMLVWRVARIASPADVARYCVPAATGDAVLVEPFVPEVPGGAGVALPLDLARAARQALQGRRMVLAGGLRPDTVAAAIAVVRPDVVDVSSGVEQAPASKDPVLIRRFVEAAVGDLRFP
jgi:phosphoribosylanthranilate isomerase